MNNAIEYLKSKLKENDTIIIACSSGPDSMCLLSIAMKLKNINIICGHVNHNTRIENDEEEKYLKEYCKKNNIIFESTKLEKLSNSNFESIARKYRYEFLNKLKKKYHAKYILTAHHGDDEIETILMRISRGSTLSGYIGIKKEDNNYLRPLLYTNKEEIIEYLENNNIKYYIDKTNNEDIHTRNRYRHNILPFLKKENDSIHLKYLLFSEKLLEYDNFIIKYIKDKKLIKNNKVNIDILLKEDKLIQKKVIELIIKDIQKNDLLEINDEVIDNILKLLKSRKSNSYINLNNNYIAKKNYNIFEIVKNKDVLEYNEVFDKYFENEKWIIKRIDDNNNKSNYILRINSKEIKLPIIIRSKKEKDVMIVKNLGSKKIKDIFINEKILREDRIDYPIVVDGENNILWLPGLKKSKFDKEKSEKYDIILFSERKKFNEKCKKGKCN